MLHKPNSNNRQVQRTRRWIFEAFMILIAEQPYAKITVSDIIKKAGIARQTFYRNYKNKDDIIIQYFEDGFSPGLFEVTDTGSKSNIQDIVITIDLKYLLEYRRELITLIKIPDVESLVAAKFKEWQHLFLGNYKTLLSRENYLLFQYIVDYQVAGCLRVFSDWFNNGMPVKIEKLNSILDKLTVSSRIISSNIPNIIMNIKA
jgi:AcrR family transcriptional regulator